VDVMLPSKYMLLVWLLLELVDYVRVLSHHGYVQHHCLNNQLRIVPTLEFNNEVWKNWTGSHL